jgi:putative membrane protein
MLQIIVNLFLSTAVLLITAMIVPGIDILSWGAAVLACIIIAVLNVAVRPILSLLTLPITILTLGIFSFVINAILLYMTAGLIDGFNVEGWGSAFLGAIVLAIVQMIMNAITPGHRKILG